MADSCFFRITATKTLFFFAPCCGVIKPSSTNTQCMTNVDHTKNIQVQYSQECTVRRQQKTKEEQNQRHNYSTEKKEERKSMDVRGFSKKHFTGMEDAEWRSMRRLRVLYCTKTRGRLCWLSFFLSSDHFLLLAAACVLSSSVDFVWRRATNEKTQQQSVSSPFRWWAAGGLIYTGRSNFFGHHFSQTTTYSTTSKTTRRKGERPRASVECWALTCLLLLPSFRFLTTKLFVVVVWTGQSVVL